MSGWVQGWQFRLKELGRVGWLGLALLFGCAVVALAVLLPAMRHQQQLESDIARLRTEMSRHRGVWVDRSPQASLNVFYRFLPPETSAAQQVSAIFAAADASGLYLEKAEYTLTRDRVASLSHYQVILPLRGTYTDIRFFVMTLLNTMPAVAVNELSFKREDIHSPEVEARLRLTFFLRRPS